MTMSRHPERIPFAKLNLGTPNRAEGRTQVGLVRTVRAVGNVEPRDRRRSKPKLFSYEEGLGWRMPRLPGMQSVRDASTRKRANLGAYVSDRLEVTNVEWPQCSKTWPRTEHPGTHESRVFCKFKMADIRVVLGHAPPIARGSADAREEWLAMAADLCDTDMDLIFLGDPNGLLERLQALVGGRIYSPSEGDGVLVKGFTIPDPRTETIINGVPVQTDHHKGVILGRAVRS